MALMTARFPQKNRLAALVVALGLLLAACQSESPSSAPFPAATPAMATAPVQLPAPPAGHAWRAVISSQNQLGQHPLALTLSAHGYGVWEAVATP